MKMATIAAVALAVCCLVLVQFSGHCYGQLRFGFYRGKCGIANVESIVAGVVNAKFKRDPTIVAALLRMQFHDCFVMGCDASILLDGPSSEKTAPPNLSVRGFDIIDAAKAAVELVCPGVVSCADIIVMATRDAVRLGGGWQYMVQTGRRDGMVSLASNVNLPAPNIAVSQAIAMFANKGLSATDMVYLLGGHTVGVAHSVLIQDRLYNFQNSGKPDPTMDPSLANQLRLTCPQNSTGANTTSLDQRTPLIVDNNYYKDIVSHRGILQIDQEIALDALTKDIVANLATNGFGFFPRFSQAMVDLGAVQVLTGRQGEIRKSCRKVN